MQIKPRKTKQIQEKVLGFSWIPFADSGLFNGLQRIQIKKSGSRFGLCSKRLNLISRSSPLLPFATSRHAPHPLIRKNSSTELRFTRIKNAHRMR
jgi:hypothetical protein